MTPDRVKIGIALARISYGLGLLEQAQEQLAAGNADLQSELRFGLDNNWPEDAVLERLGRHAVEVEARIRNARTLLMNLDLRPEHLADLARMCGRQAA